MFNEKSEKWIEIYKKLIKINFWLCIAFGVIGGISDAGWKFLGMEIIGDDGFLDFILWVLIGGIIGFVQLVTNMLIIQFLDNVQTIRKKLEEK